MQCDFVLCCVLTVLFYGVSNINKGIYKKRTWGSGEEGKEGEKEGEGIVLTRVLFFQH